MIAEIVITNWPTAATILGVAAVIGWTVCRILISLLNSTWESKPSVSDVLPPVEPMWSEKVTTTTIDHDAIKDILKEMGYGTAVNQAALDSGIAGVTKAMERDYSKLMQRIDEIRALKEAPYPYAKDDTSTFVPKNQPGDACH